MVHQTNHVVRTTLKRPSENTAFEDRIETLLSDPAKNMLILQKLGLDDLANKDLVNSKGTEDRAN